MCPFVLWQKGFNSYNAVFSSLFPKGISLVQNLHLNLFIVRCSWSLQACAGLLCDVTTYYILMAMIVPKTGASSARSCLCTVYACTHLKAFIYFLCKKQKIAGKKKACYPSCTAAKWDTEQINFLHRSLCGRAGKWSPIPCSAKIQAYPSCSV